MKHTLKTNTKIPIISWTKKVDEKSLKQASDIANFPFAFHHIALMPDVHAGYGMPIGGVLACFNAIIPYAVGVDIGCGVRLIKTKISVTDMKRDRLKKGLNQIQREIPTGFKHQKEKQKSKVLNKAPKLKVIKEELNSAYKQIGTLGGGNHFIEIQKDDHDKIWIMVHCGSRHLGKKVADFYHKKALDYDKKHKLEIINKELAYFPFNSKEGREYFRAMNFCLNFAKENREKIMEVIKKIINEKVEFEYDIHHNYASKEKHFGKDVVIHRKGAILAKKEQICVIPGSMGTRSYVARGLGNLDSFKSCSHGAGRAMSRKEAKRKIPVQKVIEEMKQKKIELYKEKKHNIAEEASTTYKDIDKIIEEQKDLIEIVTKLEPLGVIKG